VTSSCATSKPAGATRQIFGRFEVQSEPLQALFERWALDEALPLDRSAAPDRIWIQTEQAWFGFKGREEVLQREKNWRAASQT
jgi:hypothetical protein